MAGLTPTRAWALSRALCWVAGFAAVLAFGSNAGPHDPLGLTTPFGDLANKLVAPAARWDTTWFVLVADHGYVSILASQFYPVYPLLAKVVGLPLGSSLIGGWIVSLISFLVALWLLERLARRELGEALGRQTMLLLAFFPTAVFFSAVYSEGVFLALSIGAIYAARLGRWRWAGIVGAVATAARPTGFLIAAPILLLYLYGPRDDRPAPAGTGGWLPRHRPDASFLWLLLLPTGLLAWAGYLWEKFDNPFAVIKTGAAWHLHFTFPPVTIVRGTIRAVNGFGDVFSGAPPNNIYEWAFMVFAIVATIGALRRLPPAYGVYAAVGVFFILCFPVGGESLSSFSRYMAPLFPVLMWLAAWTSERRLYRPVLVLFAVLMVVNAARFATWHFVA